MPSLAIALGLFSTVLSVGAFANPDTQWKRPRYVAFGTANNRASWVAIEVHTHAVEHLDIPEGLLPEYLAIAPDGDFIVFTAFDGSANTTLLYRLDRKPDARPVSIGEQHGYHASPTTSPDGKWILFAHHPKARGQPTEHEPLAYAQIYRVRPDGSQLEALTSDTGCHLSPSVSRSGDLTYVHTDCMRKRWLEFAKLGPNLDQAPAKLKAPVNEPALSPDGLSVLFWVKQPNSVALYVMDVAGNDPKLKAQLVPRCPALRPQFGAKSGEILYQTSTGIWRVGPDEHQEQLFTFTR